MGPLRGYEAGVAQNWVGAVPPGPSLKVPLSMPVN